MPRQVYRPPKLTDHGCVINRTTGCSCQNSAETSQFRQNTNDEFPVGNGIESNEAGTSPTD
jgi:hypothetical protein